MCNILNLTPISVSLIFCALKKATTIYENELYSSCMTEFLHRRYILTIVSVSSRQKI